MATVYLRVGVWVVVMVGVVCNVVRPRTDSLLQSLIPPSAMGLPQNTFSDQSQKVGEKPVALLQPPPTVSITTPPPPLQHSTEEKTLAPSLTAADLQRRGSVTFVMQHSPASYFLQAGEQRGFEYELAEAFGRELDIRVDIITAPLGSEAISLLHEGKADILAGLTTTDGMEFDSVSPSQPYFETTAQVITRSDSPVSNTISQLAGQPVSLPEGSAYTYLLQNVTQALRLPSILPVHSGEESSREALAAVLSGRTAATVMMTPLVQVAQAWYPGRLRTVGTLPRPIRLVWAVRPEQTELLRTINSYLENIGRSGVKKVLTEKYFQSSPLARTATYISGGSLSAQKHVSRYDRVIARYAEEAGFDWRFVAAVIFEESRFDHRRVSGAGAYGLMQLMPFTAQLVGIKNYQDPHANIEAGVRYLSFLSRQFQDGRLHDRLAFILASYVMGLGHVEDAQRIARMQGDDPDCWNDVERVLPLLEDPKYHSRTLFGYAQGNEAVRYANAILRRYEIYSRHVDRDFPPEEVPVVQKNQAASAATG